MNIRRIQLQQMVIILSVTIFVCVYLVSRDTTSLFVNDPDYVSKTYSRAKEQKRKRNIVRYSEIVHWKDSNRSSSFEVPPVLLLSDDKRIYFHETAGRDHLNLRQLCAVESAAKKNPNRSVQIFFQTNHVNLTVDPLVSILKGYPLIAVILINVTDYFAGTVKYFYTLMQLF
jgi:lactosylceramide 4-alpha-galactosyltransferase